MSDDELIIFDGDIWEVRNIFFESNRQTFCHLVSRARGHCYKNKCWIKQRLALVPNKLLEIHCPSEIYGEK